MIFRRSSMFLDDLDVELLMLDVWLLMTIFLQEFYRKFCNSSFQMVHFHAIWRRYFHVEIWKICKTHAQDSNPNHQSTISCIKKAFPNGFWSTWTVMQITNWTHGRRRHTERIYITVSGKHHHSRTSSCKLQCSVIGRRDGGQNRTLVN